MSYKETKEAAVLAGQLTNGVYEITEDGKVNLNDLQTVFGLIVNAPRGIEGFGLIGSEQDSIGRTEKADIKAAIIESMRDVPDVDRDDWADGYTGLLSFFRLIRRATKKEVEEAILRKLKEEGPEAVIAALEAA